MSQVFDSWKADEDWASRRKKRQLELQAIIDRIRRDDQGVRAEKKKADPLGKRPRLSYPRPNYEDSTWGRFLRTDGVSDPTTRAGKLFRLRFRTPWPVFVRVRVPCVCA